MANKHGLVRKGQTFYIQNEEQNAATSPGRCGSISPTGRPAKPAVVHKPVGSTPSDEPRSGDATRDTHWS